MKKFFEEFKTFITRGNVLDMAVGVIVGGAFTGIVNGLTNNILRPLINWLIALILGGDGLSGAVTMLAPAYLEDGVTIDIAKSIFIDWGAFISAIINFFIIAFVLFLIIKTINGIKEGNEKLSTVIKDKHLSKAEKKELKQAGVDIKDKNAVEQYFTEKKQKEEEQRLLEEEQAKKEAEEAKLHTTEGLLEQIKLLLEDNLKK